MPSPTLLSLNTIYEHITNLESHGTARDPPSDKVEALLPDLRQAIENLTSREREILKLRFDRDLSLDEIARIKDITRQRVHQIIKRVIQKLKLSLSALTTGDM